MPEFWTVEEANLALPRVAELVRRVLAGEVTVPVAAEALAADGIVLRDPARGLIDFAALSGSGRPYWLCWVAGEEGIGYWHWPEDGFGGRRPVADPPA